MQVLVLSVFRKKVHLCFPIKSAPASSQWGRLLNLFSLAPLWKLGEARNFLTRNGKGTLTRVGDVHRHATAARHTPLQKERGAVSNLPRYFFLRWHDKHDVGRAQLHVLAVDAADPPNSCKYDRFVCLNRLRRALSQACGRPVLKATPSEPKEPNNCCLPDWLVNWLVNINWWKAKVGKEKKKAPI